MHASVNMTNSKRDYSLEYRHVICNGATNESNRVCARWPCWRTKTMEYICIKIEYIYQRKIIVLFRSSNVCLCLFRFMCLSKPAEARRDKLQDSLVLHRYLANVQEELAWIRDKEPLVKSDDLGRNLIGTRQN